MRRPAALLFDLDGTLVDSLGDIATGVNLTRTRFGLPPLPRAAITARVGDGSDALVRALVSLGPGRHAEALAAFLAAYDAHLLDTTRLMPGALAVVERFADRPLAVVTNKLQAQSERILAELGVRPRFRVVVGGDAVARRKPHPEPLLQALAACGIAPAHALMIGDGVNDVLAAQAAGVPVVALTGGVTPRADLEALRPDHLAAGLDGLLTLIE
jgi:phosphoglycolate phosphatase